MRETWRCEYCGRPNWDSRLSCEGCGGPMPRQSDNTKLVRPVVWDDAWLMSQQLTAGSGVDVSAHPIMELGNPEPVGWVADSDWDMDETSGSAEAWPNLTTATVHYDRDELDNISYTLD